MYILPMVNVKISRANCSRTALHCLPEYLASVLEAQGAGALLWLDVQHALIQGLKKEVNRKRVIVGDELQ